VPVTVVITRLVRAGHEAAFEGVMEDLIAAASGFTGHLGATLLRPNEPGDRRYQVVFAFDTDRHLAAWTESHERGRLLERLRPLTYGTTSTRILTGLETWFALPGHETRQPPPRYKMALASWLAIYPVGSALVAALGPSLAGQPLLVQTFVISALQVPILTWLVMPVLARALAFWLYPETASTAATASPH
jgi:antibiotic biosynthesis monooxygenase (ABM) superfamily enzyme